MAYFIMYLIVSIFDPFWILTIGIGFIFYKSTVKSVLVGAFYGFILACIVIFIEIYEFNLLDSRVLLIVFTKVIYGSLLSLIFSKIRKKFLVRT